MKLSSACIFGLVGCILISLNIFINFVSVLSSEYYTPDAFSLFMWGITIIGYILLILFFVFLLKNSKKIDSFFRSI